MKFPGIDYSWLPEHIRDGAKLYIEEGIQPGEFLSAVISNDLCEACSRADPINRRRLFDIVSFFYNEAPISCWGSVQKMDDWVKARRAERKDNT